VRQPSFIGSNVILGSDGMYTVGGSMTYVDSSANTQIGQYSCLVDPKDNSVYARVS